MLAPRLREVSVSATLAIKAEADRLRACGVPVIDFGLGEPDFDTPEHVKLAAHQAIDENFTHYTLTAGIPELRQAIASRAAERHGSDWSADEVVVSCGAKNVLFALAQALFSSGDDVAIFAPYWVSYPDQVRLAGARPVFIPTLEEDGFTPRARALADHLTPATRAVILNTPCNPSGATIPRYELASMVDIAREKDLVIISDEVYEAFTYDGERHASVGSLARQARERVVLVSALSKSYAMTGWRVGYALGPPEIMRAVVKILSHDSGQASSIAQRAALAAICGPQETLAWMRAEYERRRNLLVAGFEAIPGFRCLKPRGAFYAFPNVEGLYERFEVDSATEVANALIRKASCVTVPGEAFGMGGHIRFSYATSLDDLREGLRRIREAVASPPGRV